MSKIKVGIVGGAGYTAGELLRVLVFHPEVELTFVHSKSQAFKAVSQVHTDLFGDTDLHFTDQWTADIDVLFLCLAHGDSNAFMKCYPAGTAVKIIDLSQDFRTQVGGFVYGLPELQREKIKQAQYIANPGCFATAIQLALLPLARKTLLAKGIYVNATTGSTGAGQSASPTTHFSWRNNNLSVYKAFEHQHLREIGAGLQMLQPEWENSIKFIPQRGDFTRGILAAVSLQIEGELKLFQDLFQEFYKAHPFVHCSASAIDLKQVINTNKALIYLEKSGSDLLIVCAIDNLLKGAAGQAVQNMNLICGLDETTGLKLKPVAF